MTALHLLTDTDTGTRTLCDGEGPMTTDAAAVDCPLCRVHLDTVHALTDDSRGGGDPVCGESVWTRASVFAGDVTCGACLTVAPVTHYAADGDNVYAHGPAAACHLTVTTAHVHTVCGLDASGADREVRMSDHPAEVDCATCVAAGLPEVHAPADPAEDYSTDALCGEDNVPTDADPDAVTCAECMAVAHLSPIMVGDTVKILPHGAGYAVSRTTLFRVESLLTDNTVTPPRPLASLSVVGRPAYGRTSYVGDIVRVDA